MRLAMVMCLVSSTLFADERFASPAPDGLRPGGTLGQDLPAPPIAAEPTGIRRQVRGFPEQPPVIPHGIRGYQLDKNYNHCLYCHSRESAPRMGAPMVSVTHFMDRRQQVKATVAARRYFCTQCHVPQTDAAPLVESDFVPVEQLIREEGAR